MITSSTPDLYISTLLSSFSEAIQGFTTRHLGDIRKPSVVNQLLTSLDLGDRTWVMGEQVHGTRVAFITGAAPSEYIAGVDGILIDGKTFERPPVAAVRVADCAPVLFFDPVQMLYGAAHAGWKGTLGQIVCRMIEVMELHESKIEDIRVAIGPCISSCCYTVDEERAKQFTDMFGATSGVVADTNGKPAINVALANTILLQKAGIPVDHIDVANMCTATNINTWYSYRKDTKESFGEIAGFITLRV